MNIWFISLDGKPVHIQQLKVADKDGKTLNGTDVTAVSVTYENGKKLNLVTNPKKLAVIVSLPDGSDWKTDLPFTTR